MESFFSVWLLKLNITFEKVVHFCSMLEVALRAPVYKSRSTVNRRLGCYFSPLKTLLLLSFMTHDPHLGRYVPRRRTPG